MTTIEAVRQSTADAASNRRSAVQAKERRLRAIAADDALAIYRAGEDAIALDAHGMVNTFADDAIDTVLNSEATPAQLDAYRPAYRAAFWRNWNGLTEEV